MRALKAEPGGDIEVRGSVTLAQHLLNKNLVNELHLLIAPVINSEGRRLYAGVPELRRAKDTL